MATSTRINLHAEEITVETMQEEIRVNPVRLEEKKKFRSFGPCTPLLTAIWFGNVAVVRFLLSSGANIEARTEVSFHLYSKFRCFKVITNGTNGVFVSIRCYCWLFRVEDGWNPVIFASYQVHAEIMEMLLLAGADANDMSSVSDETTCQSIFFEIVRQMKCASGDNMC